MRLERFEDKYLLHMQVSAKPMARIGEDLWPQKNRDCRADSRKIASDEIDLKQMKPNGNTFTVWLCAPAR